MSENNALTYEEKFFLRKRIHTLTPKGIRTVQSSFFNSSDIITSYDQLGRFSQYKSELRLLELIVSIVFLILGIKGLTRSSLDDVLFVISVILIASAVYWFINIFYKLKHIGSFYFSNSMDKRLNDYEIKSNYPASKELQIFIDAILTKKKEMSIAQLLDEINSESIFENFESHAKYLKRDYLMSDEEYLSLITEIKKRF